MCNSKISRCPLAGGIAELSHISHPPCSSALFNSLKLGASRLPYIPSVEIYRQRSAPNFNSPEQNRTIIVRQGVPGAWSSRGADFNGVLDFHRPFSNDQTVYVGHNCSPCDPSN